MEELSTGRRVNLPSDDPNAFASDVQNQALQSQNDQYLRNTTNLDSMFQTADSILSTVVSSLTPGNLSGNPGCKPRL